MTCRPSLKMTCLFNMTAPARGTETRYRMDLRPDDLRVTPSPVGGLPTFASGGEQSQMRNKTLGNPSMGPDSDGATIRTRRSKVAAGIHFERGGVDRHAMSRCPNPDHGQDIGNKSPWQPAREREPQGALTRTQCQDTTVKPKPDNTGGSPEPTRGDVAKALNRSAAPAQSFSLCTASRGQIRGTRPGQTKQPAASA